MRSLIVCTDSVLFGCCCEVRAEALRTFATPGRVVILGSMFYTKLMCEPLISLLGCTCGYCMGPSHSSVWQSQHSLLKVHSFKMFAISSTGKVEPTPLTGASPTFGSGSAGPVVSSHQCEITFDMLLVHRVSPVIVSTFISCPFA